MFDDGLELCPVCGSPDLEPGERCDVGFGMSMSVQIGPDHCYTCGYIQQGSNPDDKSIEYYKACWEKGLPPHAVPLPAKHRELHSRHQEWITQNVSGSGYGKCLETSYLMLQEFPDLRLVSGHYYDACWGERSHFWLVDPEDYIIDPTAAQFPTKGNGAYVGRLVAPESCVWDEVQK